MEPLSLPLAAWLAGAVGLIGGGAWFARRPRAAAPAPLLAEPLPEGQIRRIELRMEAMEGLQADVLAKLEAVGDDGAAERRLQAMASRILGLVRDKDASLDTALAGLDQLRARLRVLEQMGDLAETRGLFEEQGTRLEAMAARLAGLEAATPPFAELADQMTRLYGQRDAMAETVFARLAPIETKQRELEVALALRDPGEALDRLGERLEALRAAQEAADQSLRASQEAADQNLRAAQEAADRNLQAAQEAALESLRAAQEAAVENLRAVQEAAMTGLGERLGARLDGVALATEARLAALEGAENPQAELVERLAALHAQKEAGLEAALGRLAPVEAQVADLGRAIAALDPAAALARLDARIEAAAAALGGRLEGLSAAQAAGLAAADSRLAALEGAESPQAELVERLAALHAQKEAGLEAALGRLAPVEARVAELEAAFAARDPRAALDQLAERLEALRAAQGAAVETLRLAQEAAVGDLRAAQEAAAGTLGGRVAALEGAGAAQSEILDRLAALHAQKDAGLEAALGRLAPVEARVAELETAFAARDPQAALDLLAERLEALRLLQEGTAEDLHAAQEASIQGLRAAQEAAIKALRASQEAAATALDGRLGGRLDGLSAAQAAGFAAADSRLAALEGPQSPQAKLAERLAALHAQKEAGLEAALGRLAPVEARVAQIERGLASWDAKGALDQLAAELSRAGERLAALEAAGSDAEAEAARLEAQAIAAQMVAARTVAEETRIFANRLSLLEASLPRLSIAQALMMQALERQAAPQSAAVWPLVEGMAETPSHLAAVEAPAPETRRGGRPVPVPKG